MNDTTATDITAWIGRKATEHDVVTLASLDRLAATFDRDDPPYRPGDPVPPMWHMMYFPMLARLSELGADGLPERGGILPPIPLPRRMFAGATTTYHQPLRAGDAIRREGEIASIVEKQGRSGALVFVKTVLKIYRESGDHAITEEQDIVYRELDTSGQAPKPVASALPKPDWRRTISPSPVMLFRYSALTFNNHRIHYDHPYTTQEEGYPGLLVHGPLIATCLAELVRDSAPERTVRTFAYRAMSPLFATSDFEVVGAPDDDVGGCRVEALTPGGAVAMAATVAFA